MKAKRFITIAMAALATAIVLRPAAVSAQPHAVYHGGHARVSVGVGFGWGYGGFGPGWGWGGGYWGRPLGWGLGAWGLGSLLYGSGYLGTKIAYTQGGYETSYVSRTAPEVEDVLLKGIKEVLAR